MLKAITASLMVILCLLGTSCASMNYRPHTEYEKVLFAQGVLWNAVDATMTASMVGSGDFVEANGIYADRGMEHNGGIISMKIATGAFIYLGGQLYPDQRLMLYKIYRGGGLAAVAWNGYQYATH